MRRAAVLIVAALAAGLAAGRPIAAQEVRIEVRSEVGRSLPDAEAYIFFGPDSVISRTLESSGDLVVRSDELDGFRRIVIRHLGFRSAFVFPEDLAPITRVELVEEAIAIEGVVAVAERQRCSAPSDPAAATRARDALSRYARPTGTKISARERVGWDTRSRAFLFEDLPRPRTRSPGSYLVWLEGPDPRADLRRSAPVDRWIEANGVVVPNSHPFVRRFLNWAYPRFDGPDAIFFTSPLFLEDAAFRIAGPSDETRVAFCFADETLRGVISLSDGAVDEISWRFTTEDPDEEAGGWARFEVEPGTGSPLLPSQGLFYRLVSPKNPELFVREATWYEDWVVRE